MPFLGHATPRFAAPRYCVPAHQAGEVLIDPINFNIKKRM
jgi:hypothetical protein